MTDNLPTTTALPADLPGDPHAAAAGLFVAVTIDGDRAHIGLDRPASDALGTLVDNVACSDIAQDSDAHGYSSADAFRLLAVAYALTGPLLKLHGYQGHHRGGQFGADPQATQLGLHISVGIDPPTGRAIITVDRAAADAFDLMLDSVDDDTTRAMIAVKYAIKAGLRRLATGR